jgi:hypothetical protein
MTAPDSGPWQSWPIPDHAVNTRHPDGRPHRLNPYGEGWIDGYETGWNATLEAIRQTRSAWADRLEPLMLTVNQARQLYGSAPPPHRQEPE